MDFYQLTIDRKSTRSFKEKDVSEAVLKEISDYYRECKKLRDSIKTTLRIIDPDTTPMMNGCVGYKDLLIKAPSYLLIISSPDEYYLENAGFAGQDMLLKLTDLGLDSCWVTINDPEELAKRLKIADGMVPAALIAFGYEKEEHSKTSRLDIINMTNVNLKKRTGYIAPKMFLDDSIYAEDMGIKDNPNILETYTDLYKGLISACCAPSFLNKQPYRFVINNGRFILTSIPDAETDEQDKHLNLGIVMLNFYRTLTQRSGVYKNWIMGTPDGEFDKPEGSEVVAYFNI